MTLPTDMSIKGLGDWAEGAGGSGNAGDPPAADQHINADKVDGYHASDIIAAATALGGGGVVATGTAIFAGNGGFVEIGATQGVPIMPDTAYVVTITPEEPTNSIVGEFWIADKSTTGFNVYNDGLGTTSFRWAISVKDSSGISSAYLNDLVDVDVSSLNGGDALIYDSSALKWKAAPGSSGGGVLAKGVATYEGNISSHTPIDFTPAASDMSYHVSITTKINNGANYPTPHVGEVVVKKISTTSFAVNNSGSDTSTEFMWAIME